MISSKIKRFLIFSSNRSDYGLLKKLIESIDKENLLNKDLFVCGSHFSKKFGMTVDEIKNDKIKIKYTLKQKIKNDDPKSSIQIINQINLKLAKIFVSKKYDALIVLGDRYEVLSASLTAKMFNIPIIHLHGGESTIALVDDVIRHAVTKLSSLHFVSHKKYKSRVISMGENPKNVYCVGGIGASNIKSTKLLKKYEIEKKIDFKIPKRFFLVTYHPLTLDNKKSDIEYNNLISVIKNYKDITFFFSAPNFDPNHKKIFKGIDILEKKYSNIKFFKSFGIQIYYSLIKLSMGIIGNSSSGILEVPSFKKPTINIGDRQGGRIRSISIIDVNSRSKNINKAIRKVLFNRSFSEKIKKTINPYYKPKTVENIIKVLKKRNFNQLNKKIFYEKN